MYKFLRLSLLVLPFAFASAAYADPQASTEMSQFSEADLRGEIINELLELAPDALNSDSQRGGQKLL